MCSYMCNPRRRRGSSGGVRRCAPRDKLSRHMLGACAISKVRASQSGTSSRESRKDELAKCRRFEKLVRRTRSDDGQLQERRCGTLPTTSRASNPPTVAPAVETAPLERQPLSFQRLGSDELVDGSTCAVAVAMAAAVTAASSPTNTTTSAEATALTAPRRSWRWQEAPREILERCRPTSSTSRASMMISDTPDSAPSLAPSHSEDHRHTSDER
jgi:hypothetical protein